MNIGAGDIIELGFFNNAQNKQVFAQALGYVSIEDLDQIIDGEKTFTGKTTIKSIVGRSELSVVAHRESNQDYDTSFSLQSPFHGGIFEIYHSPSTWYKCAKPNQVLIDSSKDLLLAMEGQERIRLHNNGIDVSNLLNVINSSNKKKELILSSTVEEQPYIGLISQSGGTLYILANNDNNSRYAIPAGFSGIASPVSEFGIAVMGALKLQVLGTGVETIGLNSASRFFANGSDGGSPILEIGYKDIQYVTEYGRWGIGANLNGEAIQADSTMYVSYRSPGSTEWDKHILSIDSDCDITIYPHTNTGGLKINGEVVFGDNYNNSFKAHAPIKGQLADERYAYKAHVHDISIYDIAGLSEFVEGGTPITNEDVTVGREVGNESITFKKRLQLDSNLSITDEQTIEDLPASAFLTKQESSLLYQKAITEIVANVTETVEYIAGEESTVDFIAHVDTTVRAGQSFYIQDGLKRGLSQLSPTYAYDGGSDNKTLLITGSIVGNVYDTNYTWELYSLGTNTDITRTGFHINAFKWLPAFNAKDTIYNPVNNYIFKTSATTFAASGIASSRKVPMSEGVTDYQALELGYNKAKFGGATRGIALFHSPRNYYHSTTPKDTWNESFLFCFTVLFGSLGEHYAISLNMNDNGMIDSSGAYLHNLTPTTDVVPFSVPGVLNFTPLQLADATLGGTTASDSVSGRDDALDKSNNFTIRSNNVFRITIYGTNTSWLTPAGKMAMEFRNNAVTNSATASASLALTSNLTYDVVVFWNHIKKTFYAFVSKDDLDLGLKDKNNIKCILDLSTVAAAQQPSGSMFTNPRANKVRATFLRGSSYSTPTATTATTTVDVEVGNVKKLRLSQTGIDSIQAAIDAQ